MYSSETLTPRLAQLPRSLRIGELRSRVLLDVIDITWDVVIGWV